jgi:hypothetical protein
MSLDPYTTIGVISFVALLGCLAVVVFMRLSGRKGR